MNRSYLILRKKISACLSIVNNFICLSHLKRKYKAFSRSRWITTSFLHFTLHYLIKLHCILGLWLHPLLPLPFTVWYLLISPVDISGKMYNHNKNVIMWHQLIRSILLSYYSYVSSTLHGIVQSCAVAPTWQACVIISLHHLSWILSMWPELSERDNQSQTEESVR